MLSLLQFKIGMLQQFNICLFPSCSCVILAGKNSHLTLLVLRQAFARVIWSSGHSSLNILIWSRELWKPSNNDRKLCSGGSFVIIIVTQKDESLAVMKVSANEILCRVRWECRPFIFVYRQHCWSWCFMELVASQSHYWVHCFWPSLRKGFTFTWMTIDRAQSDLAHSCAIFLFYLGGEI